MKALKRMHWLGLVFSVLVLAACGGGGGGEPPPGDPPPPAGSSNWDEMVWDQDDWS